MTDRSSSVACKSEQENPTSNVEEMIHALDTFTVRLPLATYMIFQEENPLPPPISSSTVHNT